MTHPSLLIMTPVAIPDAQRPATVRTFVTIGIVKLRAVLQAAANMAPPSRDHAIKELKPERLAERHTN
jgi:hypothetical protein